MKLATQIVHWPGKDSYACNEHANQLRRVADAMGFAVSSTICLTGEVCGNCENEAKVRATHE